MEVTARKTAKRLGLCVVVLVFLHALALFSILVLNHDRLLGVVPMLHLDAEENLSSWYSSVQLLMAAGILAVIGSSERKVDAGMARYWNGLAVVFLVLSLTEIAPLGGLLMQILGYGGKLKGYLRYEWVLPAMVGVLVVGGTYLWFLWRLPGRTRWFFIVSGVMFVSGALGMELLEGKLQSEYGAEALRLPIYMCYVLIEEILELTSIVMFIYGALDYVERKGLACLVRVPPAETAGAGRG